MHKKKKKDEINNSYKISTIYIYIKFINNKVEEEKKKKKVDSFIYLFICL
jgi:hypothetical protein